jgi:hypothetical protein
VPGDGPRLAFLAVLAAARAEQQQGGERAGGADQMDHRGAGEVLHAGLHLQPAAAEDPVRADRVDQAREHDRVDDVDAELDPLDRGSPHDRERHGAEDELEEPQRLDRHVPAGIRPGPGEREVRGAVLAAQEEPVRADERAAVAEREGEAHGVEHQARDREVDQDLRDDRARVLAAREADLQEGEAGLHEHHEDAGDQHPYRVDGHVGRELPVDDVLQRIRVG